MLSVQEAIDSRRAVRKYTDQDVSDEVLDRIVRSALEAPSAFNAQMRDLVVVRDPKVKQGLYEASGQQQFLDAPVVFVAVGRTEILPDDANEVLGEQLAGYVRGFQEKKTQQGLREAGLRDAMLVAGFLLLAAQAEGLATSPTTGWDEEGVKKAIGLKGREDRSIALVVAMGYADESPAHPGRVAERRVNDSF
ncbi:MAG TPA: nitroreductase family protein [Candidatus Corynebacterium gallistercoris]|uniref:Nitroreductase family protein n=1 Tax=Candidatus Corynebacterium gallistercoris TaxID=2838530 RepID=A0A9D1RYN8_9CORY|nr:nitroreductase family protein [Candidatus Corynebacterium gallistercoris]